MRSLTYFFFILITSFKKLCIFLTTTSRKKRPTAFVNRVLESSLRPVSINVCLHNVEYSLLDHFWKIFEDQKVFQFLCLIANLDKYKHLLKYFYNCLVFLSKDCISQRLKCYILSLFRLSMQK